MACSLLEIGWDDELLVNSWSELSLRELNMRRQWIACEHYRLHTVEGWPESPYKEATLSAIHSTLASLAQDSSLTAVVCPICASRRKGSAVVNIRASQPMERAA